MLLGTGTPRAWLIFTENLIEEKNEELERESETYDSGMGKFLAGGPGIEPGQPDPETGVLPLDDPPT